MADCEGINGIMATFFALIIGYWGFECRGIVFFASVGARVFLFRMQGLWGDSVFCKCRGANAFV